MKHILVQRLMVVAILAIVISGVLYLANWQWSQLPTQAEAVSQLLALEPACRDHWQVEERVGVPVPGPYGWPQSQQWLVCSVNATEILIRDR